MEDFKSRHCTLCLTTIRDENYESIEDNTEESLILVLLKLNFNNERKHTLCRVCSAKLFAAKEFRMTCLCTNNVINFYIHDETVLPLDLREVYAKERTHDLVSDDIKICRLCMEPMNSALSKSIHEEQIDIIQKLVPEMNIFLIKQPVLCNLCINSLAEHCNFLKKCSDVEQNIGYISNEQVQDVPSFVPLLGVSVKIEDIDEFVNAPELVKTECLDIKCEEIDNESESNVQEISPEASSCKEHEAQRSKHNVSSYKSGEYNHEAEHDITFEELMIVHHSSKMYECKKCDYKSKFKSCLKKHLVKHKDASDVKIHKCGICDFETKHRMNYKKHMLTHKDPLEMPVYKCESCSYETKLKKHLTRHLLTHKDSSEVQMYKCEMCDYETKYKNDVKRHLLVHKDPSELRMYKCENCSYQTRHKVNYRKHTLIHKNVSEVLMYKCGNCDYQTKYQTALKSHMSVHKDPSEVRMYKCEYCNHETKYKNALRKHTLIHKDPSEVKMYECEVCKFKTKYQMNYKKHLLIHKDPSEVQMYKCESCDYVTKYKFDVKSHMLVHKDPSEVQMYKCEVCNYKTKYKKDVRRHMLTHKSSARQIHTK